MADDDYLHKRRDNQILNQLDQVYDESDVSEDELRRRHRARHRRRVEGGR